MSTHRTQTSIITLATIGVYIGLLMAGATPCVLGQTPSATTRPFDISEELELAEKLDKKPDPTAEEWDKAIEVYFNDLADFVKNLKKLSSIEKFDPSFEIFKVKSSSYQPCPQTGTGRRISEDSTINGWVVGAIEDAKIATEHSKWLSDCLAFDGFAGRDKAKSAELSLSYDKKELSYQLSLNFNSPERSKSSGEGLLRAFEQFQIDDDEDLELVKVLHKLTRITSVNNQVQIVTRLPRAGLDALLATDAN
ncbi:MAG: hypothetical protein IPG58_04160 [Acidobacteria bacterium]|nr:hypothetical protein [Acidobacteriota bacterium]